MLFDPLKNSIFIHPDELSDWGLDFDTDYTNEDFYDDEEEIDWLE